MDFRFCCQHAAFLACRHFSLPILPPRPSTNEALYLVDALDHRLGVMSLAISFVVFHKKGGGGGGSPSVTIARSDRIVVGKANHHVHRVLTRWKRLTCSPPRREKSAR